MPTGGSLSGRAWRHLTARVYLEEAHCWLCKRPVDQSLPPTHRMGRTVDHILPRSTHPQLWLDRSNCRLAHRSCNSRRQANTPTQPTSGATRNW